MTFEVAGRTLSQIAEAFEALGSNITRAEAMIEIGAYARTQSVSNAGIVGASQTEILYAGWKPGTTDSIFGDVTTASSPGTGKFNLTQTQAGTDKVMPGSVAPA